MKKLVAIMLAATMLVAMSVTAFAGNSTGGDAILTTSITPTYTVTIPANTTVAFNATKTDFGKIEVTASQIHPDKCIKVELTTDGELNNTIDNRKVIPYVIKDRRPGDIATCYADAKKAKEELGWEAQYGIREMCEDAWRWQKNNPNGFED